MLTPSVEGPGFVSACSRRAPNTVAAQPTARWLPGRQWVCAVDSLSVGRCESVVQSVRPAAGRGFDAPSRQ